MCIFASDIPTWWCPDCHRYVEGDDHHHDTRKYRAHNGSQYPPYVRVLAVRRYAVFIDRDMTSPDCVMPFIDIRVHFDPTGSPDTYRRMQADLLAAMRDMVRALQAEEDTNVHQATPGDH